MNFHVMTLFPEMITQGVHTSITGRALDRGIIGLEAVNIRDFSHDRHNHVDDYPFGGGAGMVMQPQPVYDCYQSIAARIHSDKPARVIYMTPQGKVFSQAIAEELSKEEDLIFLCGHYEGIDERVLEEIVTDNLSIGDYVLTGGELAAMVMIDAIARLVPGVLNNDESAQYESFQDGLLEYPQYTRPVEFHGKVVPPVLRTGDHAKIEAWRKGESLKRTLLRRPELLDRADLNAADRLRLAEIVQDQFVSEHPELDMYAVFDGERVGMAQMQAWMDAQSDARRFESVDLSCCLNHMYKKPMKKLLKWIGRHLNAGGHVNATILLKSEQVSVDAEHGFSVPLHDMTFLESNTYTDGKLIWYILPENIWEKVLGQWFRIRRCEDAEKKYPSARCYEMRLKISDTK